MEGISLTQGMRSNLFALQKTADMMEQTQTRLSTGKKVNSALDNPTSFFTAKSHMERASGLDSYKDGMGEAVQAINAANTGIEGITSLIDSAIAVAESAKEADTSSSNTTQTINLSGVAAGDKLTIGGQTYTASADGTGSGDFEVGDTDAETAANLAYLVNSTTESGNDVEATSVGGSSIDLAIDNQDMVASDVQIASADEDVFSEATVSGSDEVDNLKDQYAELIDQLDTMVGDANYKGTNLLKSGSDFNLTVNFTDDNSLDLVGFDASASGLGITDTDGSTWTSKTNIQTSIDKMNDAKDTLEVEASNLSSNLSIITARQDFTDKMINTLETGADNLTLADTNEEGANMLMLQTQQTLGTNSLSMSAQSAQSVLRLF